MKQTNLFHTRLGAMLTPVDGPNPLMQGDCTGLWGDCTDMYGDCTDLPAAY